MPICQQCYQDKMVMENGTCSMCITYNSNPRLARELGLEVERGIVPQLETKITQLTQELTTERETTQEALSAGQEWHERQKGEIIAEWKEKLTNLIQQRKSQIQQELTLLKEILNHE